MLQTEVQCIQQRQPQYGLQSMDYTVWTTKYSVDYKVRYNVDYKVNHSMDSVDYKGNHSMDSVD